MFRYITAGETHGRQLTVIIEGVPAGLKIKSDDINKELVRRQKGYGRGERALNIEKDKVEITSGVRLGETIGSPICLVINNLDWENWKNIMAVDTGKIDKKDLQVNPRPGHADLCGVLKYQREDIRDILERASARETAARVAAGAVFKKLLAEFNINILSFVREIGGVKANLNNVSLKQIADLSKDSVLCTPDKNAEKEMVKQIDKAKSDGDTLGGVFTVVAAGVPPGLGNHTQWDLKLDGRIAQGLVSIQAVKGVEFGLGFGFSSIKGSSVHDEIFYSKDKGFYRKTNNAGGIEGGISNGEEIVINCVMKPIPSLTKPLSSVNIKTKKQEKAEAVRSDVCAVCSCSIVGESAVAFEIAKALKEKFGGDSIREMKTNFTNYLRQVKEY